MKRLFVILIILILGLALRLHEKSESYVEVVGKRVVCITTHKTPPDEGATEMQENTDGVFESTVTFYKNNKFASTAHPGDGPFKGYAYFSKPGIVNDSLTLSVSKADLEIKDNNQNGVFGIIKPGKKLDGIKAKVGNPSPGLATVLLSNEVGQPPVSVEVKILPGVGQGNFMIELLDGKIIPGNSGSPILQSKDGELELVGAVFAILRADGKLAAAIPAEKLLAEISKIE